jgi:AraC-like DNA-binding protein
MQVREFAGRLEIDRGWLHKLCEQTFGKPLIALLRHVWVHQALRMMKHTNLDNTDIALQFCYSEESSMARDFHKELGYGLTEARQRLTRQTLEELLL